MGFIREANIIDGDIQLQDPTGVVLGKQIKQSTGQVAITVEKDGRHEYCFSNQMSAIADKMVRYEPCSNGFFLLIFTFLASTCTASFMYLEMVCLLSMCSAVLRFL